MRVRDDIIGVFAIYLQYIKWFICYLLNKPFNL